MAGTRHGAIRWTNRTGTAARLLEAVLALPVRIDRVSTQQLELGGATAWTRTSTLVQLHGEDRTGTGEDIAYSPESQAELPETFAARTDLVGEWTIGSLAAHLDASPVHPVGGLRMDDKEGYHRWAVEAAALDLALRQRGTDLASLVGSAWQDVRVSLSMGLGDPASDEVVRRWLERDPSITFKLDSATSWTPQLVEALAAHGDAVATIDFKAMYHGDWIDNDYAPAQYEVIAHGLRGALLEDARLDSDEVLDAFDEDSLGRLAWDYPITAPEDVPGLPSSTAGFSDLRPGAINVKPSRFGSLERLLGTIALCDEHGIPCYSGGQFELGWGRTQVQEIASLCFPDAPNDCAPVMFHGASPDSDDVPLGPVHVPAHEGFGWDAPTRATLRA
jgi:O-succinylbenzoate synthase